MKTAAHQYEDKLLELAYGELPAPEASAVESHVRTCARCTEALSQIRAVRSTMGQLPMEPVPETGLESLYAYADQAARRSAAGPVPAATWWRRAMAPLMAAGALSVIGIVAYQTTREGEVVPSRAQVAEQAKVKKELVTAEPMAPPPAAAAPEPMPQPQAVAWNKDEAEKQQAATERELAKTAPRPEAKKMAAPSLGNDLAKAAKLSQERNRKGEESGGYGDFSNAVARGGKDNEAEEVKKEAPPAPLADKVASKGGEPSYGLSGGANDRAPARAEQGRVNAPPPPPLQAQGAPADSRTSLGVGLGSTGQSNRPVVSQAGPTRDDVQLEKYDAPAAVAAKPKEMVANLDAKVKQMNEARRQRDTQSELDIAMELVRTAPPKSAQRLAALNSVCLGLNALEAYEKAYPYCQALLQEYPSSREAIAYGESQHQNIQRPAKRASKNAYEADEAQKPAASPAEQQKAEPAKASESY